jgi:crotonobetainyl-CoA:carnitine CoA-transferase CaiB-like acyl-CoA transferase
MIARVVRERDGNRNPYIVPSSSFPTADGQWVVIGANTERLWQRLAIAIGRADLLADERFATLSARRKCRCGIRSYRRVSAQKPP